MLNQKKLKSKHCAFTEEKKPRHVDMEQNKRQDTLNIVWGV